MCVFVVAGVHALGAWYSDDRICSGVEQGR